MKLHEHTRTALTKWIAFIDENLKRIGVTHYLANQMTVTEKDGVFCYLHNGEVIAIARINKEESQYEFQEVTPIADTLTQNQ